MLLSLSLCLDPDVCGDGQLTRQGWVRKQIYETSGRKERLGLGGHRDRPDDILQATNEHRGSIFSIQKLLRTCNLLLQSIELDIDAAGRSRWVGRCQLEQPWRDQIISEGGKRKIGEGSGDVLLDNRHGGLEERRLQVRLLRPGQHLPSNW